MRVAVWALVLAVVGLAHAAPALKDRPKPAPGLAGDWEATELTVGGQRLDQRGVRTGFRFTADGQWGQTDGGHRRLDSVSRSILAARVSRDRQRAGENS